MGKPFYTTQEVVEILGCSERTIHYLADDGILAPLPQRTRPLLFTSETIQAAMDNGLRFPHLNREKFDV